MRVSSTDNSEIAVAPIAIVGHPVAEVVGGPEFKESLAVDIVANAAPGSLSDQLRSSLGGATLYDVTVQVKNIATFRIDNVAVASTFTRMNYDDTQAIEVADLGPLEPGSTSEQTVQVRVPALTFGEVDWSATASGQGPSVTVTDSTSSTPVLLILLAIILIVDVLILLWRFVRRRRRRGADEPDDPDDRPLMDDPDGGEAVAIASPEDKRVPELVR